ncbi:MAG: CoA transferase [Butyrivibrio sp.]|nr:CoA transferase [Butyrivibrio sp.]
MSAQILEGVKVLDISHVVAAPSGAALLADFGADVIHTELPGEDEDPVSYKSKILNRGKRNITLDFHKPGAAEIFQKLAQWADVIIANFRPSTLQRFHVDYEDALRVNPQIIYMAFSAYGRTGPNSDKPGYARAMESYAGLTYLNGYPDRPPVFSGTWIADGIGGYYIAYMVALALFHRERTGEGQLIDLGLYEPVFRLLDDVTLNYSLRGRVRERQGNAHVSSTPNSMYQAADGVYIAMPVNSDAMFLRLCDAMEREDLRTDPRTQGMRARNENRPFVDGEVQAWFSAHGSQEILALLDAHRVAAAPVNSVREIFEDAHIRARGSLIDIYDEDLGKDITVNGVCGVFSKTPGQIRWNGHRRGADNDEVYRELLHLDDAALEALRADGVI